MDLKVKLQKKKLNEKIPYWDRLRRDARDRHLETLASANDNDPHDLAARG